MTIDCAYYSLGARQQIGATTLEEAVCLPRRRSRRTTGST
jgi:hypothetical protein